MIYISHRGNLFGPDVDHENNPLYVRSALSLGFDVEVDVWLQDATFMLGHDRPQFAVDKKFLSRRGLWCHAKDIKALNALLSNDCHCFWHQNDRYTLTSKRYVWTFPGNELSDRSIVVMPETYMNMTDVNSLKCTGVCSDHVGTLRPRVV